MTSSDFERLLENEVSFDRLFCDVKTGDNFSIYYNISFSDDPIFNHANLSPWVMSTENYSVFETQRSFAEIDREAHALGIPTTIYIERAWKNSASVERAAVEYGFEIAEQMHALRKKPVVQSRDDDDLKVFATRDPDLWCRAFVKSFEIPGYWVQELKKRISAIVDGENTSLLVALEPGSTEASGCLLVQIEPEDCLGVYCVGTIPEKRNRGIAGAMMREAENRAVRRNCDLVVLQTIASDGVTPMYLHMGFETAFERDVFQLRG